jgi:hypothetical protein
VHTPQHFEQSDTYRFHQDASGELGLAGRPLRVKQPRHSCGDLQLSGGPPWVKCNGLPPSMLHCGGPFYLLHLFSQSSLLDSRRNHVNFSPKFSAQFPEPPPKSNKTSLHCKVCLQPSPVSRHSAIRCLPSWLGLLSSTLDCVTVSRVSGPWNVRSGGCKKGWGEWVCIKRSRG